MSVVRVPSVLDTLVNYLDCDVAEIDKAVAALSSTAPDELVDMLVAFYRRWTAPVRAADEYRASISTQRSVATTLVYASSVAIRDPVADWLQGHFARRVGHQPPLKARVSGRVTKSLLGMHIYSGAFAPSTKQGPASRLELAALRPAIGSLSRWAELISRGVVLPTPIALHHVPTWSAVLAGFDSDPERLGGFEFRMADELTPAERRHQRITQGHYEAQVEAQEDAAYRPRLARMSPKGRPVDPEIEAGLNYELLVQASNASCRLTPITQREWAYLEHRVRHGHEQLRRAMRAELKIVPALLSARLPVFDDLDQKTLLAMRSQSDAFVDWQLQLRRAVRSIESSVCDDDFPYDARQVLEETVLPQVHFVQQATSRSRILRNSATQKSLELMIGAATAGGRAGAGCAD
jgi:hypothetical protein